MVLHHDARAPGGFEDAFDTAAAGLADSILGIGSPRLRGLLRDSAVRAAMAADGVASAALVALLRQIADVVRRGSLIAAP